MDLPNAQENLKLFKETLTRIAATQKLVICIDELDRCRPPFALSLLEKVKHVFVIENVLGPSTFQYNTKYVWF